VTLPGMSVGERPVVYQPRAVSALAVEEVEGWTVKRYGVSALRDTPPEQVLQLGQAAVRRSLPTAWSGPLRCGFSIVHEDEDGCYVVVAWWSVNRVILHTRTWLAEWDDLTALTEAPGHATACLWELMVMCHERQAWLRTMVRPELPDLDGYLADLMPVGHY
jgi:hypothetical protein